jgi:protein-S-isoprenylcysteine O-methyltransferase Ste14
MSKRSFIINCFMTTITFPVVILLLAGNWLWVEGWIFSLWISAMILSNMVYMYLRNPALLAERSKKPGSDNQKKWDKYLLTGAYLLAVVWVVIQPLDAQRFHWSPAFAVWLKVLGGIMLVPALYLLLRPTIENTYLSTMVRIQDDRKQTVITTGVYSFVRHPLYLGCLFMLFGAALLMGSVCGLAIAVIAVIALVGRIIGEEKMLVNELEGYEAYKKKVHYRLIPLVW